jgi:hypothetical protein
MGYKLPISQLGCSTEAFKQAQAQFKQSRAGLEFAFPIVLSKYFKMINYESKV